MVLHLLGGIIRGPGSLPQTSCIVPIVIVVFLCASLHLPPLLKGLSFLELCQLFLTEALDRHDVNLVVILRIAAEAELVACRAEEAND